MSDSLRRAEMLGRCCVTLSLQPAFGAGGGGHAPTSSGPKSPGGGLLGDGPPAPDPSAAADGASRARQIDAACGGARGEIEAEKATCAALGRRSSASARM